MPQITPKPKPEDRYSCDALEALEKGGQWIDTPPLAKKSAEAGGGVAWIDTPPSSPDCRTKELLLLEVKAATCDDIVTQESESSAAETPPGPVQTVIDVVRGEGAPLSNGGEPLLTTTPDANVTPSLKLHGNDEQGEEEPVVAASKKEEEAKQNTGQDEDPSWFVHGSLVRSHDVWYPHGCHPHDVEWQTENQAMFGMVRHTCGTGRIHTEIGTTPR